MRSANFSSEAQAYCYTHSACMHAWVKHMLLANKLVVYLYDILVVELRMKLLLIISLSLLAWTLAEESKYTDRYDSVNIDEILNNRRLLVPYIKCILEKGRCTAEGKALKVHIKDGMQTACSKCTQWQRQNSRKVVKHIKENEPEYWQQMLNKYDPKGEYKNIYEPFLESDD
ncbi:chemosensory protein 1 [Aphomia sociella]